MMKKILGKKNKKIEKIIVKNIFREAETVGGKMVSLLRDHF